MKQEFLDYVEDIIAAMNDAKSFVKNIEFDEFARDKRTIFAVIRALEIVGEAVKNIQFKLGIDIPMFLGKKWPE